MRNNYYVATLVSTHLKGSIETRCVHLYICNVIVACDSTNIEPQSYEYESCYEFTLHTHNLLHTVVIQLPLASQLHIFHDRIISQVIHNSTVLISVLTSSEYPHGLSDGRGTLSALDILSELYK